jgi:5-formyltetrahydrofolate cyclo-ligase
VFPSLLLVPLTCFNPKSKHRIGYGGGYYDRYINHSRSNRLGQTFIGVGSEQLKTEEEFWG